MEDIVLSDLWSMDSLVGEFESINIPFRVLLVLLIPVKYIIMAVLLGTMFFWICTGFGTCGLWLNLAMMENLE